MVRVESLAKTYQGRRGSPPVKAVDGVSFQVPPGQLLGLLGPNGAGKTTTVKMMCGLIRPDAGQILINGTDMVRRRNQALAHVSAVLEGNRNIYWRLSCRENLEFFAGLKGRSPRDVRSEIDYYLELFKLTEKVNTEARQLSRECSRNWPLPWLSSPRARCCSSMSPPWALMSRHHLKFGSC